MMYKKLLEYLTPMLGEATANNLLKHYCARLSLSEDSISPANLPDLARAMSPMLAVWLGSAGASQVAEEIAHIGEGVVSR
ncbi:MAG: hypothetical protein L0229_22345 [Blastocatellia bacterium]|nr:hypothetical protein [Blastocatellia bacterium]